MLKSINPYTQKGIKSYAIDSNEDIVKRVQNSNKAFQSWKTYSFQKRKDCFLKLASIFSTRKNELATLITSEMGKPITEALAEIEKCVAGITYYANEAETLLKPTTTPSDASESYLTYEPLGIDFAIMPWNFPFWQTIRCAAPAMMAGNTILLKLAPNTTGCALALENCFQEAGFPSRSFQSLVIENESCALIIQQKEIKAISLTGSERAGISVATEAGRNLKKLVLELGGSDPFIVLEDADIEQTVAMAIKGRLQNTGQSCIAAKRFIVAESIYDAFKSALIQKLTTLKTGDPLDPSTQLGPMARKDLKIGLLNQVKKSMAKGAVLEYGQLNETDDSFFTPLLLSHLKPGMPAYEEELFGPVFSLFTFTKETEAIQLANDTPYGLGASIWTKDIAKAKILATKIESGMVFINDFVKSDIRLPFGGIKLSGYGRELGEAGIKEFVNVKTVFVR